MQTIRLPAQLPSEPGLQNLNKRLRANAIHLDWSDVQANQVTPQQLDTLLRGLIFSDHFERIGGNTISEELGHLIEAAFYRAENDADATTSRPMRTKSQNLPQPDTWAPPSTQRHDNEAERTVIRKMPPTIIHKLLHDNEAERTVIRKMPPITTQARLRAELEELVVRDLLGPAAGSREEIDEFHVYDRYLVGMLSPNDTPILAEEQNSQRTPTTGIQGQNGPDIGTTQATSLHPSSIGLSFCVDRATTRLQVTARWGHYVRTSSTLKTKDKFHTNQVWRRSPRGGKPFIIRVREGEIEPWEPEPKEQPGVYVQGQIRRSVNVWIVTLFLVNGQKLQSRKHIDGSYLFQPEIIVESPTGDLIFQHLPDMLQHSYKDDDKTLTRPNRQPVRFAIGHGISVHAETLTHNATRASRLSTHFVPVYEVPRTPGLETPGRRYLGICTNGQHMETVQMRVYQTFLAATQMLYNKYAAAADPWMTLVGYFSTPDEMQHLVDDTINNSIGYAERRGLTPRPRPQIRTLTSSTSSTEMLKTLSDLEQSFGITGKTRPIDILLATNTTSVSLNVKRLALMIVSGQPQTTSEYIQATSNIGRNAPGLVCIIYRSTHSHDLSHYEQFEQYHATLPM